MNHLIAMSIVSAFFTALYKLVNPLPTKEEVAAETKEYDNIRSVIFLSISLGTMLILEVRIAAFKNKKIIPTMLHISMCDELDRLFIEKYNEVFEMETAVYEVQEIVNS